MPGLKLFAEAMCCNIPVICFDKTSISEIVEHKKTGFIVKNFSSAELKKSIEWVSQNLNSNLLNNRRNKNLMNLFDSKLIAKKYIKLYESLLAN